MKKLSLLLVIALLSTSIIGCGSTEEKKETTKTETEVETEVETNKDDKENKEDNKSKITLSNTHKIPGRNIYIDVPNYQNIEEGITEVYIVHDTKYVAVTGSIRSNPTDLKQAHEEAFEKFKLRIHDHCFVNSLTVTSDSVETINGVEMYKFEGTMNCGNRQIFDAYAIGYSFIMDGIACNVIGSVIDKEQKPEMIKEIKDTVEAMIQTIRSER